VIKRCWLACYWTLCFKFGTTAIFRLFMILYDEEGIPCHLNCNKYQMFLDVLQLQTKRQKETTILRKSLNSNSVPVYNVNVPMWHNSCPC
jgi:hypothetical protein